MLCRSCQVGLFLAEEAGDLPGDRELILARACCWHEECKGKDCDCDCAKPRGLLSRMRQFRAPRLLHEMV